MGDQQVRKSYSILKTTRKLSHSAKKKKMTVIKNSSLEGFLNHGKKTEPGRSWGDNIKETILVSFWLFTVMVGAYQIAYFVYLYPQSTIYIGKAGHSRPHQYHLSLGLNDTELYVTWSTLGPVDKSLLLYCLADECDETRKAAVAEIQTTKLTEVDRVMYCHRAKMQGLKPGNSYLHWAMTRHNDKKFESKTYKYLARDISDPQIEVNLALYGDLGLKNGQSVPRLRQDVEDNRYDAIIHNGDFAYDLDTDGGEYGDKFMQMIEPIAARVPYQTSVGNHEIAENFTHYDHRFTMMNSNGERNNFYYSFNMGPVHFVAFSTEFYYFVREAGSIALNNQYEWLIKDLAHASSPEQRALRPWIIVFGHRPMYCSSRDGDDCAKEDNIIRKGFPFTGSYALEKLFYKYGVDVELYSHEHQYERFLPIYDGKVYNGTDDPSDPYHNPRAPVHIISGSAGCQERLDPFLAKHAPGSVVQISDYGYTRLKATRCKLSFEQVSDDKDGDITDRFEISKTRQNFPTESDKELNC